MFWLPTTFNNTKIAMSLENVTKPNWKKKRLQKSNDCFLWRLIQMWFFKYLFGSSKDLYRYVSCKQIGKMHKELICKSDNSTENATKL